MWEKNSYQKMNIRTINKPYFRKTIPFRAKDCGVNISELDVKVLETLEEGD